MGTVSLILPIYNEQLYLKDVLIKYIDDLENIRTKMNMDWEIIAVDDGSTDESRLILINYAKKYRNLRVVTLNGRFGKHAAVTAGFSVATGNIVMTADIDLFNPAGLFERMVKEQKESKAPIIYGFREFTGWKKKKALMSDRMTRFASEMFLLDGYFNGIVNAELYTSDVVDVLKSNPAKNKYMRTMNNWVGWEVKELWYSSEYSVEEQKQREATLKRRQENYVAPRDHGRENSGSKVYAMLFLLFAAMSLVISIVTISWRLAIYTTIMFVLTGVLFMIAWMFYMRSLLLKRVGNINYQAGDIIYEIKSILNKN